jgi:hypothetical protein
MTNQRYQYMVIRSKTSGKYYKCIAQYTVVWTPDIYRAMGFIKGSKQIDNIMQSLDVIDIELDDAPLDYIPGGLGNGQRRRL